jgi:hypothetical protein
MESEMSTKEERLARANLIIKQLGGSLFLAMTGAKDFLATETGVQFTIPRARNIRKIKISLMPNDLYDIEFWALRDTDSKLVSEMKGVYAENLPEAFTAATGLYTHL